MPDASTRVAAQRRWAAQPVAARLRVLKQARHLLAARTDALCKAIPSTLARNTADTCCSEIIPLLAACKFLENEAASILKPRRLSLRSVPLWLLGISSEVRRVPLGRILVIAPSNYPLFLPGVHVLQALAAGNSVVWKPGVGGAPIAALVAETMHQAGLPRELLEVTGESIEDGQAALAQGVDKVVFTGSAASGQSLMHQLAETLTPCVAELSGCDAVFVLPSADLTRVVKALAFGMRLNGSATCMAPRRIILVSANAARRAEFIALLIAQLEWVPGVALPEKVQRELQILLDDAARSGAKIHGEIDDAQQPVLITDAIPSMKIAQADIFAPVLTLLDAQDIDDALEVNEACPYSLTASIFGDERQARLIARDLLAGTVIVNDLMIPAADPRTPFGGRGRSGFGVTQGAEGLLEMTSPQSIIVQRSKSTRNYDATTPTHREMFDGVIQSAHAATFGQRLAGVRQLITAASKLAGKR
jgi:aldehyde dehydrogenase (NAD+)